MKPDYAFSKDKLPKGASYPLKRSFLDAALERAHISGLVQVNYLRGQRKDEILRADYHGDHRRDYYASGKTWITVYAVSSDQRQTVEAVLQKAGIRAVVEWLEKTETAGNTWRAKDHALVLKFSSTTLAINET